MFIKQFTIFSVVLFVIQTPLWAQKNIDILFVLYDAGETYGLEQLIKESQKNNVNFKVLTMGAASNLYASEQAIKLNTLLGENFIDIASWDRRDKILQRHLNKIKDELSPRVIITGTVSEVQRQISEVFAREAKIYGFYDAFTQLNEKHPINNFKHLLSEVWIPSELQITGFEKAGFKGVSVINHGSLEKWKDILSENEINKLKMQFNLQTGKKSILYIGGYGKSYQEGFEYFLNSLDNINQYNIIISPHPKTNGELEQKILQKLKIYNIKIATKTTPSFHLTQISDFVISQNSTIGVQALLQNKQVLYYHNNTRYKDIAIQSGLAIQTKEASELNKFLKSSSSNQMSIHKSLGIPKKDKRILSRTFPEWFSSFKECFKVYQY